MSAPPYSHPLRVAHLSARKPTVISLEPDADARARIAQALDLTALPAARMDLTISAAPHDGWAATGRLTARVVQPCVVTLAPVETPIDEPVRRIYSPHAVDPQPASAGAEVEMPDDEIEPLGQVIDAGAILVEALSLALPLYPRAPDAPDGDATGVPLAATDAAGPDHQRPFEGLAAMLADKNGAAG